MDLDFRVSGVGFTGICEGFQRSGVHCEGSYNEKHGILATMRRLLTYGSPLSMSTLNPRGLLIPAKALSEPLTQHSVPCSI